MALNLNYKPNKLVDITTLTEDPWLDWRRKGIGGSDVAVALNSSTYRTARELYYDKIGVDVYKRQPLHCKMIGCSIKRDGSNPIGRTIELTEQGTLLLCGWGEGHTHMTICEVGSEPCLLYTSRCV